MVSPWRAAPFSKDYPVDSYFIPNQAFVAGCADDLADLAEKHESWETAEIRWQAKVAWMNTKMPGFTYPNPDFYIRLHSSISLDGSLYWPNNAGVIIRHPGAFRFLGIRNPSQAPCCDDPTRHDPLDAADRC